MTSQGRCESTGRCGRISPTRNRRRAQQEDEETRFEPETTACAQPDEAETTTACRHSQIHSLLQRQDVPTIMCRMPRRVMRRSRGWILVHDTTTVKGYPTYRAGGTAANSFNLGITTDVRFQGDEQRDSGPNVMHTKRKRKNGREKKLNEKKETIWAKSPFGQMYHITV